MINGTFVFVYIIICLDTGYEFMYTVADKFKWKVLYA